MSAEQGSYLDWFRHRTVTKIPGLFESTFWDRVVLQVSASEPAVLHASLALAAAHRNFRNQDICHGELQWQDDEVFVLRHYNKAIAQARTLLYTGDTPSTRVALILCLLFVCVEYMRGHYSVGSAHLSGGLRLLEYRKNRPGSNLDHVDTCLAEEFARLNVQSLSFGQSTWSSSGITTFGEEAMMPTKFFSMAEARDSLLRALNACCGIYAKSYLHSRPAPDPALRGLKLGLELDLTHWMEAFESSRSVIETQLGAAGPVAYRMLRLYHTYATLALAPCLDPAGEMAFDAHLDTFLSILEQTRQIRKLVFSGIFTGTAHEIRPDAAPFVVDMAGTAPLYYTAVKCRVHGVRMQAIEMLEYTKKREGVWDSDVAACVAREIVAIEEASWQSSLASETVKAMKDHGNGDSVMSRAHRLVDTRVTLPDEPIGDITLTCSWERGSGRPPFSRTFTQRQQTWSDAEK